MAHQTLRSAMAAALMSAAGLIASPAPSFAVPGGKLGTMPNGTYRCSLPGRADIAAFIPVPERDFSITFGSTYKNAAGEGVYLLTGKELRFTSGPLKGERFMRDGEQTLRALDKDGKPQKLLCTRAAK